MRICKLSRIAEETFCPYLGEEVCIKTVQKGFNGSVYMLFERYRQCCYEEPKHYLIDEETVKITKAAMECIKNNGRLHSKEISLSDLINAPEEDILQ